MATSGTVSTTVFTTRKLIDNAYGLCKISRQEITQERIVVAQDWLFLRLSAAANKGMPLWAVQKTILPLYQNTQSVPTPVGTVNVLNVNIRRNTRLTGTATSSEGTAANAFDGDFTTACIETTPNGYIQMVMTSAASVPMFGILPNASGTWSYTILASNDNFATSTTLATVTAQTVVAGQWQWFDVQGVLDWLGYRLQATGGTILNVTELVFANNPSEIPLAPLNIDDYANLPNKVFPSQPTQYWFDRQRVQPVLTIWPAPNSSTKLWNLVAYLHRQIQDVGTMVQEIEVRQSAYLGFVKALAGDLAQVDKEVKDGNLIMRLLGDGAKAWQDLWDGESDDAPTMLTPNIGVYTR